MPPTAILIRTPTDFSKTFSEVFQHFTMGTLRREIEPVVRKCLEAIFNDLAYVARDDPDMVTAYLDSIAGPLTLLQAAGLVIFAVTRPVIVAEMKCRMTDYLVVSPNGRFSVGKEMGTLVHQFDPSCEAGVAELAKAISAKIPVRFFVTPEAVGRAYEHNVPWCQDCCLGDLV